MIYELWVPLKILATVFWCPARNSSFRYKNDF